MSHFDRLDPLDIRSLPGGMLEDAHNLRKANLGVMARIMENYSKVVGDFLELRDWNPICYAPKDQRLLLYSPSYKDPFVGWWNIPTNGWEDVHGDIAIGVSHFMPLPEAPK